MTRIPETRSHQKWYNVCPRGRPVMDWLFRPLILITFFAYITCRECLLEQCDITYNFSMERAGLTDAQRTTTYCDILKTYRKCVTSTWQACRGNLAYHGAVFAINKLEENNCPNGGVSGPSKEQKKKVNVPSSTSSAGSHQLPSCKYFGSYKFRHCGLFGDPHLKTFDSKYQTCRVNGTWTLIDNPYMSVQVTNKPVVDSSLATVPTKITVVVKSRSTPCTLEKRYEADSEYPLPSTFVDGTDRPGSDETVSLKLLHSADNRETVEIVMKYIATKLIIRRVGKYLAFSAKIPEEVVETSKTYVDEDKIELCTAGCPATEQLDIETAREYVVSREQALQECKNTENLGDDIQNTLTDYYLDWCVFDVMTAGVASDFVAVAHTGQLDALNMDPSSLKNRTKPLELPSDKSRANSASCNSNHFQLPLHFLNLVFLIARYVL